MSDNESVNSLIQKIKKAHVWIVKICTTGHHGIINDEIGIIFLMSPSKKSETIQIRSHSIFFRRELTKIIPELLRN